MAIDGRHEGMSRRLTSSFRRALFQSNQWAIDLRKAEQAMGTNTYVGDSQPLLQEVVLLKFSNIMG